MTSPTTRKQFNTAIRSDVLLNFKRACLPSGYTEVIEVLMRFFVENRALYNQVQRELSDRSRT